MYDEQKVLEAASRYQDACSEVQEAEERAAEAQLASDNARRIVAMAKAARSRAADDLLCAVNGSTPHHVLYKSDPSVGVCAEAKQAEG